MAGRSGSDEQFYLLYAHQGGLWPGERGADRRPGAGAGLQKGPPPLRRGQRGALGPAGPGEGLPAGGGPGVDGAGGRAPQPAALPGAGGRGPVPAGGGGLPSGRRGRQRHRLGQGHGLRRGRGGRRVGPLLRKAAGPGGPAGGRGAHHRSGGQRDERLVGDHQRGRLDQAGVQQRSVPPGVRRHESGAHHDPARLPDRLRLHGHPHAHHGALLPPGGGHGPHRQPGRGPDAHGDGECPGPDKGAGELRGPGGGDVGGEPLPQRPHRLRRGRGLDDPQAGARAGRALRRGPRRGSGGGVGQLGPVCIPLLPGAVRPVRRPCAGPPRRGGCGGDRPPGHWGHGGLLPGAGHAHQPPGARGGAHRGGAGPAGPQVRGGLPRGRRWCIFLCRTKYSA